MEKMLDKQHRYEQLIRETIISYTRIHGYPPTIRTIGQAIGLKSSSSVHAHIQRMLSKGLLEADMQNGIPRNLRVPGFDLYSWTGKEDDRMSSNNDRIRNILCERIYRMTSEELYYEVLSIKERGETLPYPVLNCEACKEQFGCKGEGTKECIQKFTAHGLKKFHYLSNADKEYHYKQSEVYAQTEEDSKGHREELQ